MAFKRNKTTKKHFWIFVYNTRQQALKGAKLRGLPESRVKKGRNTTYSMKVEKSLINGGNRWLGSYIFGMPEENFRQLDE